MPRRPSILYNELPIHKNKVYILKRWSVAMDLEFQSSQLGSGGELIGLLCAPDLFVGFHCDPNYVAILF